MVQAKRDNPLEQPETELELEQAPESVLQATVEALRTELAALRAQIAERDERDAAVWLPLSKFFALW